MDRLPTERLRGLRGFIPADVAEKILHAGAAGERRIVTAMFCDVVGSTTLGEQLGPERFKIVMDQVLGRIIATVSRYEGTVAQVMGDGVLAFFGAPLVHEDDAERAARAALDLREELTGYSRDLETAYGAPLQVRVGLNTGPVVLSPISDVLEVAYNALGDTVTTAARLQTAAAPGTIVASAETAKIIQPLFEIKHLGPVALKGKQEAVRAAEIVRARQVAGKGRGIEGLASPLVGRAAEFARLGEGVQAVLDGRGQIVSIIGEAGIGKSRLIAEAAAASPQLRWLEGRCLSYAGAIPYFPFVDMLREWLGVTAADPDARVRIELKTALQRLFGAAGDIAYAYLGTMLRVSLEPDAAARVADLSAESLQHQIFQIVREWAVRLAGTQPLALVFDDLHWADGTSLALIERLFDATEEAPLLVGLLMRPEREHPSWHLKGVAETRFPHRSQEIIVPPLSAEDTQQMVSHLLTLPDFPSEIRTLILEKAEGNPFFIEEVIRELIESGALVRDGSRWRATRKVTGLDIPDNVQGVLQSRIDRLPETARRALQGASVIGRLFPLRTLQLMLELNGQLDAALVDLQRHDLIVERRRLPQAEYRFKHALTQEVAYSTLVEAERRRLHRRVAEVLRQQYEGREEDIYGLLAFHYDQAGDEQQALSFFVRAGDKARTEYADRDALAHYARAVELMKRRGEGEAAGRTLLKAALAHHVAFDFRSANAAYQEAFQLLGRAAPAAPLAAAVRFRMAILSPQGLDPTISGDAPSALTMAQLFDGLVRIGPDWNIEPAAARSWEISDDGTAYRLFLHENGKWSDGRPVTAHDFVYGWLRAMRGVSSHLFHDIRGARAYQEGRTDDPADVGLRALNEHTLEVRLEGPRSYFPFVLSHQAFLPQPRWAIEERGETWTRPEYLVTNGPFVVSEWDPASHMRLVSNAHYTGRREGNITEAALVFKGFHDPAMFESGETDVQILVTMTPDEADRFQRVLHRTTPTRTSLIYFRGDVPPFNDRRVRLAFALGTDQQMLATAHRAYAVPADGGFVPPGLPGHTPHIGIPYDPARARELLAEAGFPDAAGLGPFTLDYPEGVEESLYVQLAEHWKQTLGVHLTPQMVPAAVFFDDLRARRPILGRVAWMPATPDPDYYLRVTFHSTSIYNWPHFSHRRYDELVEAAQAAADQRQRMALYHEADRLIVAEEVAVVPLLYTRTTVLVRPTVQGFWMTGVGTARIADLIVTEP